MARCYGEFYNLIVLYIYQIFSNFVYVDFFRNFSVLLTQLRYQKFPFPAGLSVEKFLKVVLFLLF